MGLAIGLPLGLLASLSPAISPACAQNIQSGQGSQTGSMPPLFPFALPWDDATRTVVDVSWLNPAPLEEKRRLTARDGHFYDATGRRVRILGVNLVFGANFPDKEDAPKIAARMRKFGINMVRLHHMDGRKAPYGLWAPNFPDQQHLDADQLDRLDFLVAQLKQAGIYVNLNLHVSRKFNEADGFPEADKLPSNGKTTAWYVPRMVELHKQFARDILGHTNPYTGQTYAQDPAVALVEIHNEDSLLDSARDGRIAGLPDRYQEPLRLGWNAYLRARYATTSALMAAWNMGSPAPGENLVRNGQMADGTNGWFLERSGTAQGAMETAPVTTENDAAANGAPAGHALAFNVATIDGTDWHVQANYGGLDFRPGANYTLKFWARSNANRFMSVNAKVEAPPWNDVGLRHGVNLTPQWQQFELGFTARDVLPGRNRISFVLGNATGTVQLADVRVTAGYQLPAGTSIERNNLPLPPLNASPWGEDYARFLMDVEQKYLSEMMGVIKGELKTRGLVTCSQASYGGVAGVWRESTTDFVDMHAYWEHPSFPGRQWDSRNWVVRNTAMVKSQSFGTLPHLAMNRVRNKPFTVSEYNHAAPNDYSAETLPLALSMAAWQDWDGFFLFDYMGSRTGYKSDRIENFFSVAHHPAKMALMPAAAALFLGGEAPYARDTSALGVPVNTLHKEAAASGSIATLWRRAGIENNQIFHSRLAAEFVPDGEVKVRGITSPAATAPGAPEWNPVEGSFRFAAPNAQMAVHRYAQSASGQFPEWNYQLAPSQKGFAVLALHSAGAHPLDQANALVLTAVGQVENPGMGWNAERTSVGTAWGNGPVHAEGIEATIRLKTKGRIAVYALDATGARRTTAGTVPVSVPVTIKDGYATFTIGPKYQTVWYEIAR